MRNYHTASTEFWAERVEDAISEYHQGIISPDVFRAKLYSLSYRGQEIEAEVRLWAPIRK